VDRAPKIRSADGSVRLGEVVTAANRPSLELAHVDLSFIRIDHATRLQFADVEIVIESPFRLTTAYDASWLDERIDLGPLLAIYPTTLVSAEIDRDLTLRLTFEGDTTIEVPADPQYESWSVVGPGSRLIVCMPGGATALAVWT
jgi:hypothetical protein